MVYQLKRAFLASKAVAAVFAIGFCSCSSNDPKPLPNGKVVSIDPSKIKRGPIRHVRLTEEQMARIHKLHRAFAEVDGQTLAQWVDDFKRDADPDSNLDTWEDMQVAYLKYCKGKELDLATKKEVFKVVLLRSMSNEQEVLRQCKLNILTEQQAKDIISGYPSEPRPVQVIEQPK